MSAKNNNLPSETLNTVLSQSTSRSPFSTEQAFNIIQEVLYKEKTKVEGETPNDTVMYQLLDSVQEPDGTIHQANLESFLVQTYRSGWKAAIDKIENDIEESNQGSAVKFEI